MVERKFMSFPSRLAQDEEFVEGFLDVMEHVKSLRNEIKFLKEEAEFTADYIVSKGLKKDFMVKYKEFALKHGINLNKENLS